MGETWLAAVLNNLMVLLPFVIVRSYQRGVRWVLGVNPVELEPGFHWKVWLYHQVEIIDVVDEVIELPIQSVITADEKLVCFSVNIGFRIVSAVDHFCNVHDFLEATAGMAMTHLAKRVRQETLVDLVADLNKLEKSLESTLTTRLRGWGTAVFSVGFTNFAEIPTQLRVFTDGNSTKHLFPIPKE